MENFPEILFFSFEQPDKGIVEIKWSVVNSQKTTVNNQIVPNNGSLQINTTAETKWILEAKNDRGVKSEEINIPKEILNDIGVQGVFNLSNEFSKEVEILKQECIEVALNQYDSKKRMNRNVLTTVRPGIKELHTEIDIALLKLKLTSKTKNIGLSLSELNVINKSLTEINETLYNQQLSILKIKTGSIEEVLGGNISQIITICGILFAASKGLLHLIKEGKTIKKIGYENKLKKIEVEEKKKLINKEKQKKKNIETLLAKNRPELNLILERMDGDFLEFIIENFDFNPYEKLKLKSIEAALDKAEVLHKEHSITEIIVQTIENSVPHKK